MRAEVFWDERYAVDPQAEIEALSREGENDIVLRSALEFFGNVSGKTILDLGAGLGQATIFFAKRGARVVAVDRSRVAVKNLTSFCSQNGLSNVVPLEMDIWDIEKVGPVDFVYGSMILHHLEPFGGFVSLLKRTLKVGGRGFFYENNGGNGLLMWFRTHVVGKLWVPKYGDDDESPLSREEKHLLSDQFELKTKILELVLFRLIAIYLFKDFLKAAFSKCDKWAFSRIPWLRRFSYYQGLYLINK